MCGIAGWVDWERDLLHERAVAQEMVAEMACRGPDAEGTSITRTAAILHRRLAVIDLPGGNQPMSAAGATLTYSGEVYNFRKLRADLESRGHAFQTASDTEVVLRAYLQWGSGCVRRFTGMFAFAIWDARKQELILARDRLGVKPLYHAPLPTGMAFASEPKALLRHPHIEPRLGSEGLAELFTMPPGKTPGMAVYEGIRELLPGTVLVYGRNGARHERYWSLESRLHTDSREATVERVRTLLDEAVSGQMLSDVPLCTLLSGGVDSSALTALALRHLTAGNADERRTLGTFSVGFSDSSFSPTVLHSGRDGPYAARAAKHLGTDHREIRLDSADLIGNLTAPVLARDLPGMGDIDISLYLLFREIRKEYTVALSGESADELFHGYGWLRPGTGAVAGFPWSRPVPEQFDILSKELRLDARLDDYRSARLHDALAEVPHLHDEPPAQRRARALAYLTLTRFLPSLLDRKDRLSMATGLEVRVPYCDHRLVEYTWNIPPHWNWSEQVGKSILRSAVRDLLPPIIAMRPKSHYPSTQSPTFGNAVTDRVRDWLASPTTPARDFFDIPKLRRLMKYEQPFHPTSPSLPWLLEFDTWLRTRNIQVI